MLTLLHAVLLVRSCVQTTVTTASFHWGFNEQKKELVITHLHPCVFLPWFSLLVREVNSEVWKCLLWCVSSFLWPVCSAASFDSEPSERMLTQHFSGNDMFWSEVQWNRAKRLSLRWKNEWQEILHWDLTRSEISLFLISVQMTKIFN